MKSPKKLNRLFASIAVAETLKVMFLTSCGSKETTDIRSTAINASARDENLESNGTGTTKSKKPEDKIKVTVPSVGANGVSTTAQTGDSAPANGNAGSILNQEPAMPGSDVAGGTKETGVSTPPGGGASQNGTASKNDGQTFFTSKVLPAFQAQCVNCHADPRQPAEIRAPLTIYSYTNMKTALSTGKSPEDNGLWNRVRNFDPHSGGDRCPSGKTQTPCSEIINWWTLEFGPPPANVAQFGKITDVSSMGRVYGYAVNPQDNAAQLPVTLYIDGPKGTGTLAASMTANAPGDDGNAPGDHAFTVDLPEAFRNGKQREIFAYVQINGEDKLLSATTTKYTAYAFSAAGRNYYQNTVQGRLGGCGGCHTISYEQQFYSMIAPSPAKGGTAINNQLINKPSQTNGTSHGGGQSCSSVNASPCAEFQTWWKMEFGGG